MKIGLLGGSFNPIHNGHLILAEKALHDLDLDEIWFLPVGNHPLKKSNDLLDFDQRVELLELSLAENKKLKVSTRDRDQGDFNYTDKLMKNLYKEFPQDSFVFITGMDIIREIHRWHNYQWLMENVEFVVFTRPGIDSDRDRFERFSNFEYIDMKPIPISSTDIRNRISRGENIEGLVPDRILEKVYHYYSVK